MAYFTEFEKQMLAAIESGNIKQYSDEESFKILQEIQSNFNKKEEEWS